MVGLLGLPACLDCLLGLGGCLLAGRACSACLFDSLTGLACLACVACVFCLLARLACLACLALRGFACFLGLLTCLACLLCLLAFLFALPAWLDLLAYFAFLLSPPERHMHASLWYAPSRAAPGSNTCLLRVRAPAGLRQIKKGVGGMGEALMNHTTTPKARSC